MPIVIFTSHIVTNCSLVNATHSCGPMMNSEGHTKYLFSIFISIVSKKTHLYLDMDGEKVVCPHNSTHYPMLVDTIALLYGKHIKTKVKKDA